MLDKIRPQKCFLGNKNRFPSPSFMEIHRRVRDAKLVEYRKKIGDIQNDFYELKMKILKKLLKVLHGKK